MLLILLKEREAVSSPIANTVHIFKKNKGVQLAQKKISRVKCIIFKCKVFFFFLFCYLILLNPGLIHVSQDGVAKRQTGRHTNIK